MPRHHSRLQRSLTSTGCLDDAGMCTVQQGLLLICAQLPTLQQQQHDIPNTGRLLAESKKPKQPELQVARA